MFIARVSLRVRVLWFISEHSLFSCMGDCVADPPPIPSFAIQKIQTDSSFGPQFTSRPSDLGISHKHILPGGPEVNGKVERSHKLIPRISTREGISRTKGDLARKLKRWQTEYNEDRPHLALQGKMPAERVRELAQSSKPVRDLF